MSDREALLQAVLDAPDDDAPRLIYADLLDELSEHDRAEFIRVQCEVYRTADNTRFTRLVKHSMKILRGHWWKWLGPIPSPAHCLNFRPHPGGPAVGVKFHRGFLSQVTAPLATLQSILPQLVAATPLERVEASDKRPHPLNPGFGWASDPSREAWPADWERTGPDSCRAPVELFRLMGGEVHGIALETEALARSAMSAAILAHAHGSRRESAHAA